MSTPTFNNPGKICAVITDWAGTIVDFGSLAPVTAVMETFRRAGVPITREEARQPMGRAKRDHLATVAAMPRVDGLWKDARGASPADVDIDRLYADFLPMQKQVLTEMSHVIPGVVETVGWLRNRGVLLGSTTGYTRELMAVVTALARDERLEIDVVLTADDVPAGRPAPWLIHRACERLGVFPMSAVVTIDDTPVGIEAGRNAGTCTVAVARTGNALGLSQVEADALSESDWQTRRSDIESMFKQAGAHFVIDSFRELPAVIEHLENTGSQMTSLRRHQVD